jgi:hypothetical protein
MNAYEAIRAADNALPGEVTAEGAVDPRWQAIIAVGNFIETDPGPIWEFIERWGVHPDDDLRMAIATCLLEHFLEFHFEAFFAPVKALVRSNPMFAETFSWCSKFGQSEVPTNAALFDTLKREASRRHSKKRQEKQP